VAKVHANKPDHTGVTLKYNNNPFAVYSPTMPKTADTRFGIPHKSLLHFGGLVQPATLMMLTWRWLLQSMMK
jgi:hypothetical protein